MLEKVADVAPIQTAVYTHPLTPASLEKEIPSPPSPSIPDEKDAIRRSLQASTWDGIFATVFSNVVGGVLLSNFLVDLHASPTQIGMLSSIPMVANLLQPLGALIADRTRSRHWYCFWVYFPSRLLWLILVAGIVLSLGGFIQPQSLIPLTLGIVFISHFTGALGSAAWLSWMATLVPRRLRGRYFGLRNGAASLTNLLSIPFLGWLVSSWHGGTIQGYGLVVLLGIAAGLVSLGFQFWMVDVDPQVQQEAVVLKSIHVVPDIDLAEVSLVEASLEDDTTTKLDPPQRKLIRREAIVMLKTRLSDLAFLSDRNFLFFLLYFGIWMFAVSLSGPFFNVYLLDDLKINLQWVTIYNSLQAGANLIMLIIWGKLADRIGNRSILLGIGVLVAITPLLWIGTGANALSLWLWFPLLHILSGGTWAAIDLCNNNLQLGVAPIRHQTSYFAIAAAIAGVCGALGTTVGGLLLEYANYGGIPGLFALSGIVRLLALLPLILVHEKRGQSFRQMMRTLFPEKNPPVVVQEQEVV